MQFSRTIAHWRGTERGSAALGAIVQQIVVAGGVENQVRRAPGNG